MRIDRRFWWLASILFFLICGGLIFATYWFNWSKTGFLNKSLWDWMQLLIIPVVLAVGGYLFNLTINRNEQKSAQLRDRTDRAIALDNQREAALQEYIDKMSELLLRENLRKSGREDEVRKIARVQTLTIQRSGLGAGLSNAVRKIARVQTLTILSRLDERRKRSVLQFLFESELIVKGQRIVDLNGANLFKAFLFQTDLRKADLTKADLGYANLREANLTEAVLVKADLIRANLREANLTGAFMGEVYIHDYDPDLGFQQDVEVLTGTNLTGADLRKAFMGEVVVLAWYDSDGVLQSEELITGANLTEANLSGANLEGIDLLRAIVTKEQLDMAKSLQGAIMPDGSKHP